jgi:hypothetical protein
MSAGFVLRAAATARGERKSWRCRWAGADASSAMSAQQFIVERLNEPPFNMRLTLVAFDEKSPFELLEIVNAIMAVLSTEHQIDLRDETPDATANRMTDFLKVLNFKNPLDKQTFKQALLHGDPGVIYPILTWMLQRLPELQKRTYLARFLMNMEIPEHMFADEEACAPPHRCCARHRITACRSPHACRRCPRCSSSSRTCRRSSRRRTRRPRSSSRS